MSVSENVPLCKCDFQSLPIGRGSGVAEVADLTVALISTLWDQKKVYFKGRKTSFISSISRLSSSVL